MAERESDTARAAEVDRLLHDAAQPRAEKKPDDHALCCDALKLGDNLPCNCDLAFRVEEWERSQTPTQPRAEQCMCYAGSDLCALHHPENFWCPKCDDPHSFRLPCKQENDDV